ncbi:MAG: serine hydrolase [Bacteroidota bacterium]|nr:serine hydrolase [Bacteroidota bacterium]
MKDYKKFPSQKIDKPSAPFLFKETVRQLDPDIPQGFNKKNYRTLEQFLEKEKTLSFLIIRNDSVLYQKYFHRYDSASILPSFSVAKSFVSALIGIAISESYIKSVDQPITDFIPELKSKPGFEKITLKHLLNMRSGIDFNEGYSSPFADMAKYYYGLNLKKYILKLKVKSAPDLHYDYQSVNTLLLGIALERATRKTLAAYLEEKIWKPLGMEFPASWSVDSRKNQTIKAFCCINARALDFAKFGRLYLNNGNWNGVQIVPSEWVKQSRSIVNDSRDSQGYPYTYHWRVTEKGCFFAKGILGQYIFVDPSKNIIIVRMGTGNADVNWPHFFEMLVQQL